MSAASKTSPARLPRSKPGTAALFPAHFAGNRVTVPFEAAWNRRDKMMYGGLEVPVLSIEDTSCAKKASGRPKDLPQATELDRIIAKRRQEK